MVAAFFHELRARVILSNKGRDIPAGSHVDGNGKLNQDDIDEAKAAEKDAKQNYKQK